MMKLGTVIPYLKKIKQIFKSRDTPLSSADINIFWQEISDFLLFQEIKIHNFLVS